MDGMSINVGSLNNNHGMFQRMANTLMKDNDSDGDGMLNLNEINISEDAFSKIDENKDTHIDSAELQDFLTLVHNDFIAGKMIENNDADGNGTLSGKEAGIPEKLFNKLDANSDGELDRGELNALANRIHGRRMAGRMGGNGKESKGSNLLNVTEEITGQIDTNGDGKVDSQEITSYLADGSVDSVAVRQL